jgi:hypothetical protein
VVHLDCWIDVVVVEYRATDRRWGPFGAHLEFWIDVVVEYPATLLVPFEPPFPDFCFFGEIETTTWTSFVLHL